MSYFKDSYPAFRYPIEDENVPGFRLAQLGAIHSAAGHFVNRKEPGIITMPTGSGKTAVLISCAFVLQSKRVLIITPSRLVREQIAEEVANLTRLKQMSALPIDHPLPSVRNVSKRITSIEHWEEMRDCDVVVATVQSISPEFDAIPEPPQDLFDLVLVDEAHHSPARTWRTIINHFSFARQLLFTATPFRQDQREIKGRFIFTYDLKNAYQDGIFGEIVFRPVIPLDGEDHDIAIAKRAEQQFTTDKNSGYNHHLMIRTDSKERAKELLEKYRTQTGLRLEIITGNTSLRSVKKIIAQLQNDDLDGIICVNMLGEGFNFPSLKIAAIHSPHKSLSVTLQFVGRFARTVGVNLGPATFLAIPSDVEIETERLYDNRAIWQEMIQNLAAARIVHEEETREVIQSFNPVTSVPDLSDLSLYVLEPYYHVKIYQMESDINIENEITFPSRFQIIYNAVSLPHNASIYITREISLPRWATDDRLSNVQSNLFIFYYDSATKLFFVCASQKTTGLYEEIMESFNAMEPRPLSLVRLNKALNDLSGTEFFNVGMRNRVTSNTTESYRILTGPSADKSVLKSDSRLFHRGHAFGRGVDNGNAVTIGLSSASKIWSNKSSKLPELIAWCARLAEKINSDRIPITNSGLDYLDAGEELEELPGKIIFADWPTTIYRNSISARFINSSGVEVRAPLMDFNLLVNGEESTEDAVVVQLQYETMILRFTFSFITDKFFEPLSDTEPEVLVEHDRGRIPFIDFINHEMLIFYTSDLSLIDGYSIFRAPSEDLSPFEQDSIEIADWGGSNVNIQSEFDNTVAGLLSIHDYIEQVLANSDAEVVYYDHGTGEIADFISFQKIDGRILISFYHCKKSPSAIPGHRIDSISDLTNQIVKSTIWASKQRILSNIRRRFNGSIGRHTFVRGDLATLEGMLSLIAPALVDFKFIAVQPGIRKEGLPVEHLNMLAAANDHLIRAGYKSLGTLFS